MNARDELLAALTAERYDNRWWVTPEPLDAVAEAHDDDLSAARRRRLMASDFDRLNASEREAQ